MDIVIQRFNLFRPTPNPHVIPPVFLEYQNAFMFAEVQGSQVFVNNAPLTFQATLVRSEQANLSKSQPICTWKFGHMNFRFIVG